MLRVIREVRPTYIVGENVFGLVNWSDGLVFDEVQSDLEAIGYEVTSFVLPACAVNAPHRRDRVWIVAHAKSDYDRGNAGKLQEQNEQERKEGQEKRFSEFGGASEVFTTNAASKQDKRNRQGGFFAEPSRVNEYGDAANAEQQRRERPDRLTRSIRFKQGTWNNWPTVEPTICFGNDGIPAGLDGITFSKWRNESIKAVGNAVVPQVVLKIFEAINIIHSQHNNTQ